MSKKTNLIIVLAVIIILIIVVVLTMKSRNKEVEQPLSQTNIELKNAVNSDTTKSINENLNNIDVENSTVNTDLQSVDTELNKL